MPKFESEEALCAAFSEDARADGWTVYPEPKDWDLLLVRRGVQVGIEAKLLGGVEVLLQALPALTSMPMRRRGRLARTGFPGPHYRAVLVGGFAGRGRGAREGRRSALYAIAAYTGIVVLEPPEPLVATNWLRIGWRENLDDERRPRRLGRPTGLDVRAYRWRPSKLVWTPPFVPDRPAGVPSPSSVGPWQLAAVALELVVEAGGWISLGDARRITDRYDGNWNPSTLLSRYFRSTGERIGNGIRGHRWVPNGVRRPTSEWADVAEYLRAQSG